jgi:glucose uptake protein GlcU
VPPPLNLIVRALKEKSMSSDNYPWKWAANFLFDIALFVIIIFILIKPVFYGIENLTASKLAIIGTLVVSLCMLIEKREATIYKEPIYQSILSNSLQATGLNMLAATRSRLLKSTFYLMLLGTIVGGIGGVGL